MILVSRHLTDYIDVPDFFTIRINLAWEHDIEELLNHISMLKNDIFLDIPINRKKPPNNKWDINKIIKACQDEPLIKYLAISNVEEPKDYEEILYAISNLQELYNVCIVPKIESVKAAEHIELIIGGLPKIPQRTIMIDHDDMFTDLMSRDIDPSTLYTNYILPIIRKCKKYDVRVLRTAGVVFTDK